jgi:histidinol-phosphate aminotransferase
MKSIGLSRRALLRGFSAGAAITSMPELASFAVDAPPSSSSISAGVSSKPLGLDRNQNAHGPSRLALAAMKEGVQASSYPEEQCEKLQSRIADLHRVSPEQVVLGCGSSEILRMAVDAFVSPSRRLLVARPTFDWIAEWGRRAGASVLAVPLRPDYSHDVDAMLDRADGSTGLVYVCNPNNPTGTLTRRPELEAFIRKLPDSTQVLIDEAYHQYIGESVEHVSFVERRLDDARVIVTRTFSTIYGLAGLRVGYAVCDADTARRLRSEQLPYAVNAVGAKAARAALDDEDHLRACFAQNTNDRQEFFNQANARMLRVIDSQANFVMLNTGVDAATVVQHFKTHDVLVAGEIPGFDTHVRVSLGSADDMRRFWSVWDLLPAHHHM